MYALYNVQVYYHDCFFLHLFTIAFPIGHAMSLYFFFFIEDNRDIL